MTCCKGDIQIHDTPVYSMELVHDVDGECQPFEPPAGYDVLELIFLMPNGLTITKTATLTTLGSPADRWFLEYQVQFGDGVGSPGEFHDNEGPIMVQGFLHWPTGQFHTAVVSTDSGDQELRVFPNLD